MKTLNYRSSRQLSAVSVEVTDHTARLLSEVLAKKVATEEGMVRLVSANDFLSKIYRKEKAK